MAHYRKSQASWLINQDLKHIFLYHNIDIPFTKHEAHSETHQPEK
jgi:hypothetical protein